MFIEDKKKTARQLVGVEKWKRSKSYGALSNGSGILEWVGGMGKTYTAIELIVKPYLMANKGYQIVCILIPRIELIEQWKKEVRARLGESFLDRVLIYTPHYLIQNNIQVLRVNLLVVDELHMFYGDEFIQYINKTKIYFEYNLGLTATFEDMSGRHKKIESLWKVIDKIDPDYALEQGFISRFQEYNLGLELSEEDKNAYNILSRVIGKESGKFEPFGYHAAVKILFGGKDKNGKYFEAIAWANLWARKQGWKPNCAPEVNDMWNPYKVIGYAKKLMTAINTRKSFINTHSLKLSIGLALVKRFKGIKTITFGQDTTFTDLLHGDCLTNGIKSVVYHTVLASRPMKDKEGEWITYQSGKKKGEVRLFGKTSLKKYAINSIRNNQADIIHTAMALDIGFDVQNMRIGLIFSRGNNFNSQKQRGFRVYRVDPFAPDDKVLVVNIYFKGTIDEKWLANAQSKTSTPIHEVETIEEIDFNPNADKFEI